MACQGAGFAGQRAGACHLVGGMSYGAGRAEKAPRLALVCCSSLGNRVNLFVSLHRLYPGPE